MSVAMTLASSGMSCATRPGTNDLPLLDGQRLRQQPTRGDQVRGESELRLPHDAEIGDVLDNPVDEIRIEEHEPGLLTNHRGHSAECPGCSLVRLIQELGTARRRVLRCLRGYTRDDDLSSD